VIRKSRKLVSLLSFAPYRRALLKAGVAATVEHNKVPFVADHKTVIDVGGGRGQFAVFACARFPDATILCFEPLPGSAAKIRRILGDSPRVEIQQVAVGVESGTTSVHVSDDSDSSSLLRPTREQLRRYPSTGSVRTLDVEVRKLDDLVESVELPLLIKIDVQGGELDVLVGAERLLSEATELFVECSFVELYENQPLAGDVIAFLGDHGFDLAGIYSGSYGDDGVCVQADLLFRKAFRRGRGLTDSVSV
jgi:FkbM family methyltransferase